MQKKPAKGNKINQVLPKKLTKHPKSFPNSEPCFHNFMLIIWLTWLTVSRHCKTCDTLCRCVVCITVRRRCEMWLRGANCLVTPPPTQEYEISNVRKCIYQRMDSQNIKSLIFHTCWPVATNIQFSCLSKSNGVRAADFSYLVSKLFLAGICDIVCFQYLSPNFDNCQPSSGQWHD